MNTNTENKLKVFGIILACILGLVALAMIVMMTYPAKVGIEGHCRIDGIEYVNVAAHGAHCFGNFADTFCPLPKTIDCDVGGDASMSLLHTLLMQVS